MIEWKVFGYLNQYRVSNTGTVETRVKHASCKGVVLGEWKPKTTKFHVCDSTGGGYIRVGISLFQGSQNISYVHRLVYENFIGPIPKGMQVNHIDGDRMNNHLTNLELCSPKENIANAVARGSFKNIGALGGNMDWAKVLTMATLINSGARNVDIAKHFNLDPSNVSKFKNKKREAWSTLHYLVELQVKRKEVA